MLDCALTLLLLPPVAMFQLSRALTVDTQLSTLMQAALPSSLYPPPLLQHSSAPHAPAAAAAAASSSSSLPKSTIMHIEGVATKAERAAQQSARTEDALKPAEPTTPTEEELQELEVDEQLERASVQKARVKFTAKAKNHEALRLRLVKARQQFEAATAKRKEKRRLELIESKRQAALQRQRSED